MIPSGHCLFIGRSNIVYFTVPMHTSAESNCQRRYVHRLFWNKSDAGSNNSNNNKKQQQGDEREQQEREPEQEQQQQQQ